MRIPRTIAGAAIAAALAVTAACEQAVEANPELYNTESGHGEQVERPGADGAIELPQSATIDSAAAVERALAPPEPHEAAPGGDEH